MSDGLRRGWLIGALAGAVVLLVGSMLAVALLAARADATTGWGPAGSGPGISGRCPGMSGGPWRDGDTWSRRGMMGGGAGPWDRRDSSPRRNGD